jgi:2-polyprenyl-3-methyl-5-hydroxy-6-metoxy-1,4-benzoquinol methylase
MFNKISQFYSRVKRHFQHRREISQIIGYQRDKSGDAKSVVQSYQFPSSSDELKRSSLLNQWWYYSVELMKGINTKGAYSEDFPMLPRLILRRCDLKGADCLDMGSMEGIIPVLMCKGGAQSVLAIDAVEHCDEKMQALKHYYNVDFEFRKVGLMYDLHEKIKGKSFDLINCSGLLYHVISPLHVLMGVRPLLKKNGIIIISTNVTTDDRYVMEFNNAGRLQVEDNTFWYVSIKLLDYMLRFLKLAPIDAVFLPHSSIPSSTVRLMTDQPTGYLSVACRAVNQPSSEDADKWIMNATQKSWEYLGLSDWEMVESQARSDILYKHKSNPTYWNEETKSLDLHRFIMETTSIAPTSNKKDTHYLSLSDID